jgi:hypothetical protein
VTVKVAVLVPGAGQSAQVGAAGAGHGGQACVTTIGAHGDSNGGAENVTGVDALTGTPPPAGENPSPSEAGTPPPVGGDTGGAVEAIPPAGEVPGRDSVAAPPVGAVVGGS